MKDTTVTGERRVPRVVKWIGIGAAVALGGFLAFLGVLAAAMSHYGIG